MALGLMALIVLLVLALSALISVESTASNQTLIAAQARQNALAGAYLGLGTLQKYAGLDMRITARADINSSNSKNPYWLGVWNSASNANEPICWLVSSTSNAGRTPRDTIANAQAVKICNIATNASAFSPTGSLACPVTVERISIQTGESANGGYAWWIEDENAKASVALRNDALTMDSADYNGVTQDERTNARSLYLPRLGLENLAENTGEDFVLSESVSSMIERMTTAKALQHLDASKFTSVAEVSERDLTACAYGVLAHTLPNITPTLKVDLSTALHPRDGNFWSYDSSERMWVPARTPNGTLPSAWSQWEAPLSAFLNAWRAEEENLFSAYGTSDAPRLPLVSPIPKNPSKGQPFFSTVPVLSEFAMAYNPYWRADSLKPGFSSAALLEGSQMGKASTANFIGGWKNYWSATREVLMNLYRENPNNGTIPGYVRYMVWGFFEFWNPYTAQVVMPETNGSGANTCALRAQITGLPKHKITYWKNKSGRNTLTYNAEKIRRVTNEWAELDSRFNGESGELDLQEKLGTPYCVNLKLPKQASIAGGSLQVWCGLNGTRSEGNTSAAWGFKDGLTMAENASGIYASEDEGQIMNTFAVYCFRTDVTFSGMQARAMPIASDEYGLYQRISVYDITRYNSYLQVEDYSAPPSYLVDVYWVPNQGKSANGGVKIGSYKMPTPPKLNWGQEFEASATAPWAFSYDGTPINQYLSKNVVCRFGYVFTRKDGGRFDNWLSALPDPRSFDQNGEENQFELLQEPDQLYAASTNALSTLSFTLLERPNALVRQRSPLRDRMVDNITRDTALKYNELCRFQRDSDNYFNRVYTDENFRPLEDVSCKVPLFEIPTSRPLSLGVLQHLAIEGTRPFSIGNSWGESVNVGESLSANNVFDVFTLTGLDDSDLSKLQDLTKPLPNPNLTPLWSRAGAPPNVSTDAPIAAHFLTKGAFNINSTSTLAWTALLSGIFLDGNGGAQWNFWEVNAKTGDFENATQVNLGLKRAFFRFPHTAQFTYVAPSPTEVRNHNSLAYHNQEQGTDSMPYRKGVRHLSSEQIKSIAANVVERIRMRAKPFRSLAEFLSPDEGGASVLENAIKEAGINESSDWDVEGKAENPPPEYASAYLTQADIMNTLAPVLQARGDTFKIRGYGDVRTSDGSVAATALCELTVQRVPDLADEHDAGTIATPEANGFGRKFKVISIKWIKES